MQGSSDGGVKRVFSSRTPRGSLSWPALGFTVLLTIVLLWLIWATTASELLQWLVLIASLLVWNYLLVRAGQQEVNRWHDEEQGTQGSVLLLACGGVLLLLAAGLMAISQDWSLYPGPETVYFAFVSVPIMIWTNVHYQDR